MIAKIISTRLGIKETQVKATLQLLDEDATIPFIARYRKEMTGSLDEVAISNIAQQADKLKELSKRKETVLATIDKQGQLTPELQKRIEDCWEATELEDIYLPFKPKRRTKAQMAREKGLEPLALLVMQERISSNEELNRSANKFVKGEVKSVEEALEGVADIIAEHISEDEKCRNAVRREFNYTATISSKVVKGKEAEGDKFKDYFNFSVPLKHCSSHRLLAMRRGEREGFLKVSISPDDALAEDKLLRLRVRRSGAASNLIADACSHAYKKLLKPSIENEFAALSKEKADTEAIAVFANGLRQLLMASPLGQKRVMGIDPGFRTGCKVVCLDSHGMLLHHDVIFPHPPINKQAEAVAMIQQLVKKYAIEAISIGNGTAGRETELFVLSLNLMQSTVNGQSSKVEVYSVNEDGASVYSASKIAREEFPDEDVTVRGAVSIARRLMDPLAELVKIDCKSLGVGQYQHDVDQAALKQQLDQTVVSCVNLVGVDVNTASKHLLTYVSGLGPTLAQNIIDYRTEHGGFKTRRELLKVKRMGEKAFEQCAGFLRVSGGKNPLDNSSVHPESYSVVERMAKDLGTDVATLMKDAALRSRIDANKYSDVGKETLADILKELEKPGRDPREPLETFAFDSRVHKPEDLMVGMRLRGIVTNITNFGAFVDVGVHEKGLVHVSQLANHFVKDPFSVVQVGQTVEVTVVGVDLQRNRISLSMKE
ncbi:MAG: RNA-binding transcriptional accessory protein [Bacteroidaceae bacterium]|nr:RNA-binding transcriptional accessory protein [Bacteroidaceae bacterium]